MAYVSKQLVQNVREEMKQVCKDYGIKVTVSGTSGSSLKIKVSSGALDFIGNYKENNTDEKDSRIECLRINTYYLENDFSGKVLECLKKIVSIANKGNHDNSDIMTDYFDVGWYVDILIGEWDKPYVFKG